MEGLSEPQVPHLIDEEPLRRFQAFVRQLRFIDGDKVGRPFELDPYQWAIVRLLLGAKDPETKLRLHRKLFLSVGRKNGKTTFSVILCLFFLVVDSEPRPEIYLIAVDRSQARIAFNMARDYISASPYLRKFLQVTEYKSEIRNSRNNGVLKALGSDGANAHGKNPSVVLADEMAVWKNQELYDAMSTGSNARKQPVFLILSTAGTDTQSIFYREYTYAKAVLSGAVKDSSYLVFLREATSTDDWTDEKVWYKSNPALGIHLYVENLRKECEEAKHRPEKQNAFRRLYLNAWTTSRTAFFPVQKWNALHEPELTVEDLHGQDIFLAVDLSAVKDLTAIVGVVPFNEKRYLIPWSYKPESSLYDHEQRDRVPYQRWADDGQLLTTPGYLIDQRILASDIKGIGELFNIREIAFDLKMANQLLLELTEEGYVCTKFLQSFNWMDSAMKAFEGGILNSTIRHFDNQVLAWCVENVAIETNRDDQIRPSKRLSRQRIDTAVAAIMAYDRCERVLAADAVESQKPDPEPAWVGAIF